MNMVKTAHKTSSLANVDWALQTTTGVLWRSWLRRDRMMTMMMTKVLKETSTQSRSRLVKSMNPEPDAMVTRVHRYDGHYHLSRIDDGGKAEGPTAGEEVSVYSSAVRASQRCYCCWSILLVKWAAVLPKVR